MEYKILNQYEENGILIKELTIDGVHVESTVKVAIPTSDTIEPQEPKPSIEQQILAELQYNTALTEMKMLGGM